jgi:hypothetical protein
VIKHIYNRLKSETPAFFQKIFYFMASLTVLGVALIPYNDSLPEWLKPVGGYCIAIGAVGSFLAKATTTDVALSEKK